MLREKLESLVNSCEASYRSLLADTAQLKLALDAHRNKQPAPAMPPAGQSFSEHISAAIVTARIYFPSLAESVYELHRQLRDHGSVAHARAMTAVSDGTFVFERPDIANVKALRFAMYDKFRKLIENDFDLTSP